MEFKKLFSIGFFCFSSLLCAAGGHDEEVKKRLQNDFLSALTRQDYSALKEAVKELCSKKFENSYMPDAVHYLKSSDRDILEAKRDFFDYDPDTLTLYDVLLVMGDREAVNAVKEVFPGMDFSNRSLNAEFWAYERFVKLCDASKCAFFDACDVKWRGDDSGEVVTCLHLAVGDKLFHVVEFLLKNDAFVNSHDEESYTPLQALCLNNYQIWEADPSIKEIAKLLMRHGANLGDDEQSEANLYDELCDLNAATFANFLVKLEEEREGQEVSLGKRMREEPSDEDFE